MLYLEAAICLEAEFPLPRGPQSFPSIGPQLIRYGPPTRDTFHCSLVCFLGSQPQHVDVPGPGVKSELQLPTYTTATGNTESEPHALTIPHLVAMLDP